MYAPVRGPQLDRSWVVGPNCGIDGSLALNYGAWVVPRGNVMGRSSKVSTEFSPRQAAAFSGLSMTMLDYLCRHRIIVPGAAKGRGRGIQRLFSFGDLVVLRAIARLLAAGVSVYRLKRGLTRLRATHSEITATAMPASFLVTDGRDVYLQHKTGVVELLSNGQLGFAFVIEMETLRQEAVKFARNQVSSEPLDRRRVPASRRLAG